MEKNVLISFLVPCYNSEAYMHICLDSLLKANHDQIEIIVVDDGSKDKTGEIADKYQAENPDVIRVIHKENGGHGDAINDGIKVATGKYFKIVDSDDWADLDALNKVLEAISNAKEEPDLYLMNYVYYKGYENRAKVINYKSVLEPNKLLTWKDVKFKNLEKKGRIKTIIRAKNTTILILAEICSFFALQAFPTTIAALTPQIEPPAAKVAENGFSSLKSLLAKKYIQIKLIMLTIQACKIATKEASSIKFRLKLAPIMTMPVFM